MKLPGTRIEALLNLAKILRGDVATDLTVCEICSQLRIHEITALFVGGAVGISKIKRFEPVQLL